MLAVEGEVFEAFARRLGQSTTLNVDYGSTPLAFDKRALPKLQRNVLHVPSTDIHPLERRSRSWSRSLKLPRCFQRRHVTIVELNQRKEGTKTPSYRTSFAYKGQIENVQLFLVPTEQATRWRAVQILTPSLSLRDHTLYSTRYLFPPRLALLSSEWLSNRCAADAQRYYLSADFANENITIEEAVEDPRKSSARDGHEGESFERRQESSVGSASKQLW